MECIVPQNFNLLPFLYYSFIRVIMFITLKQEVHFLLYLLGHILLILSPDNITLIHWIKIGHVII